MELHTPDGLVVELVGCVSYLGGGSDGSGVGRQGRNRVAVAHPPLRVLADVLEQQIVVFEEIEVGSSVFARACRFYVSSVAPRQELCPIANAQDRQAASDAGEVNLEGFLVVNRERTARQNHAYHSRVVVREFVVRQNFTECIEFAQTTSNELCCLRTEIKNDDFLLHIIIYCIYISLSNTIVALSLKHYRLQQDQVRLPLKDLAFPGGPYPYEAGSILDCSKLPQNLDRVQ